jgi:hypothetical protein
MNREAERHARDVRDTRDVLLLVGLRMPLVTLRKWPRRDLHRALLWAGREHLHASDNPVRRLPRPSFLPHPCAMQVGRGIWTMPLRSAGSHRGRRAPVLAAPDRRAARRARGRAPSVGYVGSRSATPFR